MNNFNAVLEKLNEIREIVESQPVGAYIYRGESEHYKDVSSNLYRFCRDNNLPIVYPAGIKRLLEQSLRKFRRFSDEREEAEFADMIQHYGGLTNRIDFTSDYLIALFFACHGSSDKNGRIIVLEQDKVNFPGAKGYCEIRHLETSNNRVIAQKSIFVIPSEGFIDIKQEGVLEVNIPKNLKRDILQFLHKHHGISVETIYRDFSGAIRLQSVYLEATSCYLQGNAWILNRQYDLAIKKFDEAIKLDSHYAAAYQGLGVARAYKDDYELAIENFTEAVELSQYNAKSYLSRGNVYAKTGDYEQAIADFEKADQVQIPRDNIVLPRIHMSLGNAYAQIEEYNKAIEILNHAISLLPDFQDRFSGRHSQDTYKIGCTLYNSLGNVYVKNDEDDQAIACFEEAMQLDENCFLPYLNLSAIYTKINERENAIKCYDKLVTTMFKSNFATYLCRGHFYAKIGEHGKAIEDFNETIKILRTHLENIHEGEVDCNKWAVAAFYNRYDAYLKIGNAEKANEDFNKAKELDPELTEGSHISFLFPMMALIQKPDIYLYPPLHGWEVDLSP
ncbi:MAG: tetratricopeptide repeat protein [Candidatus Poribacteria bacterium]|nr:tetratricopeptide repeat protein [Candidatus Poribacteria bacterium]